MPTRRKRFTDHDVAEAVATTTSYRAAIIALGDTPTNAAYMHLLARVFERGLDTSHFTGQGWAKGSTQDYDDRQQRMLKRLVAGGKGRAYSATKLINAGLKTAQCNKCGLKEWLGQPIIFDCDHINGDQTDNRLVNLQILCPNCHRQTPTFGRRKRM